MCGGEDQCIICLADRWKYMLDGCETLRQPVSEVEMVFERCSSAELQLGCANDVSPLNGIVNR